MKQLWTIDTEAKIEERFNGKIYGIGDSFNDDQYIWDYKEKAKEVNFMDDTGYINCRNLENSYTNSGSTNIIPQSNTPGQNISSSPFQNPMVMMNNTTSNTSNTSIHHNPHTNSQMF